MNLALSPEAAASATFWHSVESWLRLLAAIAALVLIELSHPCFAAWAAAELVLAPPELELGVDVLLVAPELELGVDVLLLLLLPQPATTTLPATTSDSRTMIFVRMYESLRSKVSRYRIRPPARRQVRSERVNVPHRTSAIATRSGHESTRALAARVDSDRANGVSLATRSQLRRATPIATGR